MRFRRSLSFIVLLLAIFASFSFVGVVGAQSTQTSYTVKLNYLTVQLSYPSQVMPGDVVTVGVQASGRNNYDAITLNLQIFYTDGNNLHQIGWTTVNTSNYPNSGTSLNKQIQFTVPQDAPRTSLVAALTEKVQTAYYSYYYFPGYYNYSSTNCQYFPDYYYYYGYCSYNGYAYPSNSYNTSTDTGFAPLCYIKATTPEFVSLQSEYQTLQQQSAQSQAENQQLKQNLQDAQNKIAQQNATIADLNQQLTAKQSSNGVVEVAAVVLGIVAIILGGFVAYLSRARNKTPQKL